MVLAIAAGATLCGMCGYLAISDWAKGLGQKARGVDVITYQNVFKISARLGVDTFQNHLTLVLMWMKWGQTRNISRAVKLVYEYLWFDPTYTDVLVRQIATAGNLYRALIKFTRSFFSCSVSLSP